MFFVCEKASGYKAAGCKSVSAYLSINASRLTVTELVVAALIDGHHQRPQLQELIHGVGLRPSVIIVSHSVAEETVTHLFALTDD